MDRPFVLELQCLLSRVKEGATLCSNDVDVLDRALTCPANTEIANSLNDALTILERHPPQTFFPSFDAINTHAQRTQTRLLAHTVLTSRIRNQWPTFDISIRDCLKVFVVNGIENCLSGTQRPLLQSYNNSLVGILRFEGQSLLRQFVDNLDEVGLNTSPQRIINNLTILQMLLEEGVSFQHEQYSQEVFEVFREGMDSSMRTILKYLCLCLHNEGDERAMRINHTLEVIQNSIEFVPAFELFNCNLVEMLVGLIPERQLKDVLTACFQQIFRFRQAGTNGNSHAKIAKKLLLILESYLLLFEQSQKEHFPQDYDTASTEDSFQSRTTRRKNATKNQPHTDLMYLLYEFLMRYVPYMDKVKGESDLQLQFSGNLKLYFSQDLYKAFGMIYWRLMRFMMKVMDCFDPFLIGEVSQDVLEESRKVVVCVKLLIVMQGKLKLQSREQTSALIEKAVLCFTTLPQEFQRHYLLFKMIINGGQIAQELPPFSSELEQDYKQLIAQILAQKEVTQRYFDILHTNFNQTLKDFMLQMTKNRPKQPNTNLQLLNTLNRVCWSSVYAYNINTDLTQRPKFPKFQKELFKCLQKDSSEYPLISKFISVSSRYLTQIYYDHQRSVKTAIMPTLNAGINDNSVQFTLIILSKVLLSPKLQPHFANQEIQTIINRLRTLQKMNPNDDSLLCLYPALMHLFMKIEEMAHKNKTDLKVRDMLAHLMDEQPTELQAFSKTNYVNDHPQLQRSILYFRKLTEISIFLRKNPSFTFTIWMQNKLSSTIQMFQFKDTLYSLQLTNTEKENFDIVHMVKFKQHYLQMLAQMAAISNILPTLGDMDVRRKGKHVEKVKILIDMQTTMRRDFAAQRYFKIKEYFGFALEFYKLISSNCIRDRVQMLNHSIFQVMQSLQEWSQDSQVISAKYKFWKEVVRSHLMALSIRNKEHLLHLLAEFEMVTTQTTQLENILEVFETYAKSLYEQCINNAKPIPAEFIQLFLKTFQLLFSDHCKNKEIFDRIAALLLSYAQLACKVSFSLHPRKPNIDVLFFSLQSHIMGKLGVEFDQEHCCRLQGLLHRRERWFLEVRDYVVYLNRVLRTMGK